MEVIKRKICLNDFISRIPSLIPDVNNKNDEKIGSWGKIPKSVVLYGQNITYKTLMSSYYIILNMVISSIYYKYDASGSKWILLNEDWRNIIKSNEKVDYLYELPQVESTDNTIVGINSIDKIIKFNEVFNQIMHGNYTCFDVIQEIHNIIGRIIVPLIYVCPNCKTKHLGFNMTSCPDCGDEHLNLEMPIYLPYLMYVKNIPDFIDKLRDLKNKTNNGCCEKIYYEEYGGDIILTFLEEENKKWEEYYNVLSINPTLNIPILLTSQVQDLGMYRTYNVDVLDDDENNEIQSTEYSKQIVHTSGESKFKTLRKRKRSLDDNGNEMPGIFNSETESIELPYQVGYIKNIQIYDDILYGDSIVSMREVVDGAVKTSEYYTALKDKLKKTEYQEGTLYNPIDGISTSDVMELSIAYGSTASTLDEVISFYETDRLSREASLAEKIVRILKEKYPSIYALKQSFLFSYKLTYGDLDKENVYENENGETIFPIRQITITKNYEKNLYITFDNASLEVVYVIGGRLKETPEGIFVNETIPFNLDEDKYDTWDGKGIWYKERIPLKKLCFDTFTINGKTYNLLYDVVDTDSIETIYEYDGIDFPRKNYILCNDIMYQSNMYQENATNDAVFKDEKMGSLSFPLKEKYDVAIVRGSSSAFEKHLQLSEIKTWKDLENYRNGMFLNK